MRSIDARTVTVTVPPYSCWSDAQLLEEIKKAIAGATFHRDQTNREIRERLLPLLYELRERTRRKTPGFYETLAKIGLRPATVRQWFYRSNAADEIIGMMLGEAPALPREHESDNRDELLLTHAWNLAVAVRRNQFTYARKLATQFIEAMKERRPLSGPVADHLRRAEQKIPMFTIQEGG